MKPCFKKRLLQGSTLFAPRATAIECLLAVFVLLPIGIAWIKGYAWDSVNVLVYGCVALVYWLRLLWSLYRHGPLGPPLLQIQNDQLTIFAAISPLNSVRQIDLRGINTITVYGPLHQRSQRLDYVDGRQTEVDFHWLAADEAIVIELLRRYLAHGKGRVLVKSPPGWVSSVRGEYDADDPV